MRRFQKIAISIIAVALISGFGFMVYVNDYYKAISKTTSANVLVDYGRDIVIRPVKDQKDIGIAFYPGAKVASDAYIELLAPLAEQGYTIVIAQMPYHLAVFNPNRMSDIMEQQSDIKTWYLGGHSLGGAMAAKYVASHPDDVAGLFLLASYSTSDLSAFQGSVISLRGNMDTVLNMDKVNKNQTNLPKPTHYQILEGGNHAGFGSYGDQAGDATANIKPEFQQKLTRDAVLTMMSKVQP